MLKKQESNELIRGLFKQKPLALAITLAVLPMQYVMAEEQNAEIEESDESHVSDATELDNMVVQADALDMSAVGPDMGYHAQHSMTATKFNMPIIKTPRAISITTRQEMDDRQVRDLADALRYSPSVDGANYGDDNRQDGTIVRGFVQTNAGKYLDGVRQMNTGFYFWKTNTDSLERIEVLRGAASSMYGQNPPGGLINSISKRPQGDEDILDVMVEYGSWDRKKTMIDVGSGTDMFSWRLVSSYLHRHTQYDDGDQPKEEKIFFKPSFRFQNNATDLTVSFDYQKENSDPLLQFFPIEGSLHSRNGRYIDDDTPIGDSELEKQNRNQWSGSWQLDHAFSENTRIHQSARYYQVRLDYTDATYVGYGQNSSNPVLAALSGEGDITRYVTRQDGVQDTFTIDTHLIHDFATGFIDHSVILGMDYQMTEVETDSYSGYPITADFSQQLIPGIANPLFNVLDPSYHGDIGVVNALSPTLAQMTDADMTTQHTDAHQVGGYMQWRMSWNDKLNIMWGIRYDDAKTTVKTATYKSVGKADEVTNSLSLSYAFDSGFVPYFSWSEFFDPLTNVSSNGSIAAPSTGDTYELGLKYQPPGFDGYFAVAMWETDQQNLVTSTNPVTLDFNQTGMVKSQGVEFETVANITDRLTFMGSATFMNVEIKKTETAAEKGKRPQSVANNLAKAWLSYRFGGFAEGLKMSGGMVYTGETFGDNTETIKVPEFTTFDASISYEKKGFRAQVAAHNLFDHEYVTNCTSSFYCYYGERFNVISSVGYSW